MCIAVRIEECPPRKWYPLLSIHFLVVTLEVALFLFSFVPRRMIWWLKWL